MAAAAGSPQLMQPSVIAETSSPLFPSRRYCIRPPSPARRTPRRSARCSRRRCSTRGGRRSTCPGSAASPASAGAARPARAATGWRRAAARRRRAGRPAADSSPVASGNHGMKPMPCSRAVVEQRLGVAVGEVEEVLHGHDRRRSSAPPRAASTVTSERPMCRILPSSWSCLSSPTWSATGYVGVDAVQLEQVDPLEAEPAQAQLDLLAQVRRLARAESTRPGPGGSARPWSRSRRRRRTGAAPRAAGPRRRTGRRSRRCRRR